MTTEAQKAAMRRYYEKNKAFTRVYVLKLNKERDADIIAKLDAEPNKTDYVRNIIRGME